MKRQFLDNLEPGAPVDDVFFVLEAAGTGEGRHPVHARLSDRGGIVPATAAHEPALADGGKLTAGNFIRARGRAELERGGIVIAITDADVVDGEGLDQRDFLPGSFRDPGELYGYLEYFLTEVYDEDYARLLASFIDDAGFMERFRLAPGELRSHHAYLGGLLEHTVSVATLCQHTAVQHPRLNSDLLITAALLHDIGKIDEFSWQGRLEFTGEGMLRGHVLMGHGMIEERIGALAGFPREKELQLLHAVISHHGELEWGAPKRPLSAEALALHHLDNLDAKLKGYFEVIGGNRDISWPELQNLFRRPLDEPRAADREFRRRA